VVAITGRFVHHRDIGGVNFLESLRCRHCMARWTPRRLLAPSGCTSDPPCGTSSAPAAANIPDSHIPRGICWNCHRHGPSPSSSRTLMWATPLASSPGRKICHRVQHIPRLLTPGGWTIAHDCHKLARHLDSLHQQRAARNCGQCSPTSCICFPPPLPTQ
jgi:hypothetical protein